MKGEDFLRELNDLETSIIEEAREPVIRKKKKINGNIIKFTALAACIAIFTGAVIARSISVHQNKNIHPAAENTNGQKELQIKEEMTETSSNIEITNEKQITWLDYDVNQDGIKDKITVYIPAEYESKMAGCTVTDGSSQNILYQKSFSPAYPDWGGLYLSEREGTLYFIEYNPVLYQGVGNYYYEVFFFDGEEKVILNENSIFFDLSYINNRHENNDIIERMAEFYYEINHYLLNSILLVSTINNEIQYSKEDNKISKQEEYNFLYEYNFQYTQENMYEKLREYFLYLDEKMEYAKNYISLAVIENTLTSSGASFEIVNTSGMDGYGTDEYYIEEFRGEQWEICDNTSDNAVYKDAMTWSAADGETDSFTVDWSDIYGELDSGTYRLVTKVFFSENTSVQEIGYFNIPNSNHTNIETTISKDNYGKE